MRALLKTEFFRLRCEWFTWLTLLACPLLGFVFGAYAVSQYEWEPVPRLCLLGISFSVLLSLCLLFHFHVEKNENTVRNKIITGCSKGKIYLSRLIAAAITAALLWTVALGVFTFMCWEILQPYPRNELLMMLAVSYLMQLVWAALAVLLGSVVTAKSAGEVLHVLAVLGMSMAGIRIHQALQEPQWKPYGVSQDRASTEEEFHQTLESGGYKLELTGDDGSALFVVQNEEKDKEIYYRSVVEEQFVYTHFTYHTYYNENIHYVRQPLRTIYRCLETVLPSGQLSVMEARGLYHIRMTNTTAAEAESDAWKLLLECRPEWFPARSLALILLLSVSGWAVYRRLDLK